MKDRLYNIDLMRFLFAVGIVFLHVSGMKGIPGIQAFYQSIGNASVIVECFFVLAGFFLQKSLLSKEMSFCQFLWAKVARLWPTLFVSLLVLYLVNGMTGSQLIMNSFFLQCVGYTEQYKGITWFVSPLFWVLLFYCGLFLSEQNEKKRNFIISLIVYVSYLLCMTGAHGGFSRNFAFSFVPMSVCRALGGVGLGMLVCEYVKFAEGARGGGVFYKCANTLVELVAFGALFVNLFVQKWAARPLFVIVICMVVLLIAFVRRRGYFSNWMDKPKLAYLGRYAYAIYVMQPVGMYWLNKLTPVLRTHHVSGGGAYVFTPYC